MQEERRVEIGTCRRKQAGDDAPDRVEKLELVRGADGDVALEAGGKRLKLVLLTGENGTGKTELGRAMVKAAGAAEGKAPLPGARQGPLEDFGRRTGLFDRIRSEPGVVQLLRERPGTVEETECAERNAPGPAGAAASALALQGTPAGGLVVLNQPELGLHPRVAAEIATEALQAANRGATVVIETHCDAIDRRIRMDLRDREGGIGPDEAAVLWLEERGGPVWRLGFDDEGNKLAAPPRYRRWEMKETRRSLGL